MGFPETFQKIPIRDDGGIKVDGDALGMIADGMISWIGGGSAAVADTGPQDSFDGSELGVRSPKSSEAKGGGFEFHFRQLLVQGEDVGGGSSVFDRESEWA